MKEIMVLPEKLLLILALVSVEESIACSPGRSESKLATDILEERFTIPRD